MHAEPRPKLAYTPAELAEAVGIGRTKVFHEIREGRLRSFKYGNRRLIRHEDAQEWLDHIADMEADQC